MVAAVLMLNSDLSPIKMPIQRLDFEQAIKRVMAGSCYVVLSYDRKIKTAHPEVLDQYNLRYWPSVIARKAYLKRNYKPTLTKHGIYIRDNGKCQYCGDPVAAGDKTMEHYHPKSLGGEFTWENILLACKDCNSRKGNELPIGKWKPLKKPYVPDSWELISKELNMPVTIYDERWKTFIPRWTGPISVEDPFK